MASKPTRTRTAKGPAPDSNAPTLLDLDPLLGVHAGQLRARQANYRAMHTVIDAQGGLLGSVSEGHRYFGLTRASLDGQPGVWYREWAPGAEALSLIGDFNNWDRNANPCVRDQWGVWSLFLPDAAYAHRLMHDSRVKVHVLAANGRMDRIPAYARRVVQEKDGSFTAKYWNPPDYAWVHPTPARKAGLRIYEAHIGMAQEAEKVGSFQEFIDTVLPRIASLGYNAIQLMAVMEHPYYGSFGYHVSSFYAVSSRFGTPEDLKKLIDAAHGMGILVIMDVIHSHAVKNAAEGLNLFDGTTFQYFHAGARRLHPTWDSLCFDYSKFEVQRFLLSNLRFWLEEFRFDGFRFDGVSSMIYMDHGLNRIFTSYNDYFGANIDEYAVGYLMLANELVHTLNPGAITVAEEVSGMVGMARPVSEIGFGFDYRLSMGVPDYWIKILKERRDENWDLGELWFILLNRRANEKHIGYVESHDQALVGDKTLAFQLMDKEMYSNMSRYQPNPVIERGIALHKEIRLLTFSLAGEGYLNFMGNEFGHPDWIDFPREGNGYSHRFARRQWSLVDNSQLRYQDLNRFDGAMLELDARFSLLEDPFIEQLKLDDGMKLLVYRRGPLVFAVNLHPSASYSNLRIPVPDPRDYRLILDTDHVDFGGQGRVMSNITYPLQSVPYNGRAQSIQIYLPSRTAQVLAPI